jgi:beta-1,4-mannosyl-glycoprotein beta-1,4-N-acetylglucosaminyltransferase
MNIFDCTTYFEEDEMMDLRFHILDKFIYKFIVCESTYSHSGVKKKINFDPNKFGKFKDKIIHIILDNEPEGIVLGDKNLATLRMNSIKRIVHQRNEIFIGLQDALSNDYIIYSDNDEIPNLENINFKKNKKKIILFKQKIFYYKFNLLLKRINWYGSKCCKYKDLKSITWLRDIKNKKYNFFRLDTLFSEKRYMDLKIIDNGGWHFSNLKSPSDLIKKYLNDEMHSEFETRKVDLKDIEDLVNRKVINYNHKAKSNSNVEKKQKNEFNLTKVNLEILPIYLQENITKYKKWFD